MCWLDNSKLFWVEILRTSVMIYFSIWNVIFVLIIFWNFLISSGISCTHTLSVDFCVQPIIGDISLMCTDLHSSKYCGYACSGILKCYL